MSDDPVVETLRAFVPAAATINREVSRVLAAYAEVGRCLAETVARDLERINAEMRRARLARASRPAASEGGERP